MITGLMMQVVDATATPTPRPGQFGIGGSGGLTVNSDSINQASLGLADLIPKVLLLGCLLAAVMLIYTTWSNRKNK